VLMHPRESITLIKFKQKFFD